MRTIAENLANASSLGQKPGDLPYRRKILTFRNQLDRALGVDLVEVARRTFDRSEFGKELNPSHPAADGEGYVLQPNVNGLVEFMDMREAQRSYEANLSTSSRTPRPCSCAPSTSCAERSPHQVSPH